MIVIGCGKAKLDHAAPAGELYTGSLFRAASRYAEARHDSQDHAWLILSAKHGLIDPGTVIEPYEQKLALKGEALRLWATRAAEEFESWGPAVAEVLMGERYAVPFCKALSELSIAWITPLAGKGTGERLAWLKRATEREKRRAA